MGANGGLKVPLIPEFVVRILPDWTWISAFIIFSTSFLSCSASHAVPALRSFFLILAPKVLQELRQWLTQPVLFILVNCVILYIWLSAAVQVDRHVASKQESQVKSHSISSLQGELTDETTEMMQPSSGRNSHEVSPVISDDKQLSLMSNADDEKARANVDCQGYGPDLGSVAEVEKFDGVPKDDGKIKKLRRQATAPGERKCKSQSKPIYHLCSESRSATAPAVSAPREPLNTEEVGVKFVDKRSLSFPQNSSSVIVRDMSESEGINEAMIIDNEELNQRIESFFTKFRQQLQLQRQESLRRRNQHCYWGN